MESFNSGTDAVTIQLFQEGQDTAAYETKVSGGTQSGNKFTASYSFSDVPSGTYTMKVMKPKHATREYTITVATEAVTQDVEIWLKGDATGDGIINSTDAMQINRYAATKPSMFDQGDDALKAYTLLVADINGDGIVNSTDSMQINRYVASKPSKFDSF